MVSATQALARRPQGVGMQPPRGRLVGRFVMGLFQERRGCAKFGVNAVDGNAGGRGHIPRCRHRLAGDIEIVKVALGLGGARLVKVWLPVGALLGGEKFLTRHKRPDKPAEHHRPAQVEDAPRLLADLDLAEEIPCVQYEVGHIARIERGRHGSKGLQPGPRGHGRGPGHGRIEQGEEGRIVAGRLESHCRACFNARHAAQHRVGCGKTVDDLAELAAP